MKNIKEITLIALVITIIVLLILAGISITMLGGDNGILTKATESKKATLQREQEEKIALAISTAKMNELVKLDENVLKKELDNYFGEGQYIKSGDIDSDWEITIGDNSYKIDKNAKIEKIDIESEYKGLTITSKTENVQFIKADGITQGDPNNIETGDIVKYGDYEYHYNQKYYTHMNTGWSTDETMDGWGVALLDRSKSQYGELCGTIFNKELKNIDFLFGAGVVTGTSIITAPQIPNGVTSMGSTFQKCTNLTTAPIIPSSVKNMSYTFAECKMLTGIIEINANPTEFSRCFMGTSKTIMLQGKSEVLENLVEEYDNVIVSGK